MTLNQGSTLEAVARCEFNGVEDVVGVYQFHLESAVPLTDDQGIADVIQFLETIYALLVPTISILQFFRDIRVTNWDTKQVYGTYPWPTLTAGTDAGAPLPPGVAALVNFSTGVSRVTPRKYFGVMSENNLVTPGVWFSAFTAILVNVGALMLANYTAVNGIWAYGYQSPKTLQWEYPNAATVTNIPAYQRRRKQGRGV